MLYVSRSKISSTATSLKFIRDTFEKVYRLTLILEFLNTDIYLKGRLALKGGTAINLAILDLPRLSLDIDMDFVDNIPKDQMLHQREKITERIHSYMSSMGYILSPKTKNYHALDSFVYEYYNLGGMRDNIKIEINYMLRSHILIPRDYVLNYQWMESSFSVLCLAPVEIYSSKIVALINRGTPRDLFDVYNMFKINLFDENELALLKKGVLFYTSIGADTIPDDFTFEKIISISQQRIKTELIPVLKRGEWFVADEAEAYIIQHLKNVLEITREELSYLDAFKQKLYNPDLLFNNDEILTRISNHPMALWKCSDKY